MRLVLLLKRIKRPWLLLLGFILLIALILRVYGIGFDLPYIYHPDEPSYIATSQNIFKTGDLNPHFFNYPSLFFYVNSLAYVPYYLLGKLLGSFATRSDILLPVSVAMGVSKSPMPTTVLLGRLVTVSFGVGTVGLAAAIGTRLTGNVRIGLLSAMFLALSPANIYYSRFATPDTFVVFFAGLSLLAAVFVYRQGKTWHYLLAGLAIGFTASTKYNGALSVLPLLVAHFLRYGKRSLREQRLYLAVLFSGIGFLIASPFALLDFSTFLTDLRFEGRHYATGHAGMEGSSLQWYLEHMWRTAGIVYLLAALEIVRGLLSRSRELILVAAFPVTYFLFISSFAVRNGRTFLPITLFLFLLAASFLVFLVRWRDELGSKMARRGLNLLVLMLLAASLSQLILNTAETLDTLTTVDSRETARTWINENLPAEAKIAFEPYSPFLEPSRFSLYAFGTMIEHDGNWYADQHFDYLIFSEGMYGRFLQDPNRYSREVSQYEQLFSAFELVRLFTDGGYEVRVYRIK